jgi:Domain of unknown function (DUF4157)
MFAATSHEPSKSETMAARGSAKPETAPANHVQVNPLWQSLAMRSGIVQPKLTVGQADDPYEREADRVADQVMRMPAPQSDGRGLSITPLTSRQAQRKCSECEEEEGTLQRKESGGAAKFPATLPDSAVPSLQLKGITGTIPEDVPKGMWGEFKLNLQEQLFGDTHKSEAEDFWREYGGVSGLITFTPSTDKAVKNAKQIGLVQIARVMDDESGTVVALQSRNPGVPSGVQTEEKPEAGIKGGFFLDQPYHRILAGVAPVSRFYIEQGTGWMLPGEQYGSKKGKEVTPAGLRDTPTWLRDCTYHFETYAQSTKDYTNYGGVQWGFTLRMKPDLEPGYDKDGSVVALKKPAEIIPHEIQPLYALSPTAQDAIARFEEHMKSVESGDGKSTEPEKQPQRKPIDHQPLQEMESEAALASLSTGLGRAPDDASRVFMEARLDYDFSQVRIFDNRNAQAAAAALNARAFTLGNRIFFGAGQYQPNTMDGARLLAHELWHVVQQGQADRIGGAAPYAAANLQASMRGRDGGIIQRQDNGSDTGISRTEEGRLRLDPEKGPFPPEILAEHQATPREESLYFPFWQARLMTRWEQKGNFERALLKWARRTYSTEVHRAFENSLLYGMMGDSLGSLWQTFQGAVADAWEFNDKNYVSGSIEGGMYDVVSRIYVDINPNVQDPIHDKWEAKLIWGFKKIKVPPKVPWAGWAVRNGIGAPPGPLPEKCYIDVSPGGVDAQLVYVTTEDGRRIPQLEWSDPERLQDITQEALANPDPACLEFEGEVD